MSDNMRLVARVEDQFSAPLAELRNALAETAKVPGVANLRKDFAEFEGTVNRLRQTATGLNAVGGLGGMLGLGGIGSVASIAGIAASMRDLARTQVEMRHFSRETGIAAGHLRELQSLGQKFQIEPEAMTGAASRFADHMTDIRRGLGSVYGEIRQKAPQLAKDLRESTSNFEAFGKALGWLEKQGANPVDQRRWAEALGLGGLERLFTDGPGALRRAWEEVRRSGIGKDSPDLDRQAKALVDATEKFDRALDGLKRTVGPSILGEMVGVLTKLGDQFERFVRAGRAWQEGRYLDALSQADRGKNWNEGRGAPAWERKHEMAPSGPLGPGKPGADIEQRLAAARKAMAEFYSGKDQTADREKELRDEVRKLTEELKRIREGGATVQQQSFGGPTGFRDLIQKAGWGTGGFGGGLGGSFGAGPSGGFGGAGGAGIGPRGDATIPRRGGGRVADVPSDPGAPGTVGGAIAPFREGARGRRRDNFDEKASQITPRLMREFNLTREQAAGIVANLGHESGGFRFYQELRPRSGRGGAGWAQWTGPRRRQFEAWATREGLDPRSDEASYGFLTRGDPEFARALRAVRRTTTAQDATVAFEQTFERAGVKAWRSRFDFARRAMGLADADSDAPPAMTRMGDASMLRKAQRAGVIGPNGVEGSLNGKVDVTLTLPPGVEAKTSTQGIVSAVKLNRGSSMATSQSE